VAEIRTANCREFLSLLVSFDLHVKMEQHLFFFWVYSPIQALVASMKLSGSLQLLDLGQTVGLLGRVISSSQGLCLYTNTEKTHTKQKQ
jgi:hypothetical protein